MSLKNLQELGCLGFDDHAQIVKFNGRTLIVILKGSCEFN